MRRATDEGTSLTSNLEPEHVEETLRGHLQGRAPRRSALVRIGEPLELLAQDVSRAAKRVGAAEHERGGERRRGSRRVHVHAVAEEHRRGPVRPGVAADGARRGDGRREQRQHGRGSHAEECVTSMAGCTSEARRALAVALLRGEAETCGVTTSASSFGIHGRALRARAPGVCLVAGLLARAAAPQPTLDGLTYSLAAAKAHSERETQRLTAFFDGRSAAAAHHQPAAAKRCQLVDQPS